MMRKENKMNIGNHSLITWQWVIVVHTIILTRWSM